MRCYEFIAKTKKVLDVQPSVAQGQAKVAQLVNQIAASDQQRPPTAEEKVIAQMQYANMKKQADRTYAAQLQQQLIAIQAKQAGVALPRVGGRVKRTISKD